MTDTTLYERLGGNAGVAEIVEEMYRRVMADPTLERFFRDVPMDNLRHMQTVFFAAAFDGPVAPSNLSLAHIHQGLGITRADFTRFVECLLEAMEQRGVSREDIDTTVARIATYADDVIGQAGVDG